MQIILSVVRALLLLVSLPWTRPMDMRIGVLYPRKAPFTWITAQRAVNESLAHAHQYGWLDGIDVSIQWRDDACEAGAASMAALRLYEEQHVHVLVGAPCHPASVVVSTLAEYWGIPFLSLVSGAHHLPLGATTFHHEHSPIHHFGAVMRQLRAHIPQTQQEAIGVVGDGCQCRTGLSLCDVMLQTGTPQAVDLRVSQWLIIDANISSVQSAVKFINQLGKKMDLVILTCMDGRSLRGLLSEAEAQGLADPYDRYLFIHFHIFDHELGPITAAPLIEGGDNTSAIYKNLLLVTYGHSCEEEDIHSRGDAPELSGDFKEMHAKYLAELLDYFFKAVNITRSDYMHGNNSDYIRNNSEYSDYMHHNNTQNNRMFLYREALQSLSQIEHCEALLIWHYTDKSAGFEQWARVELADHNLNVTLDFVSESVRVPRPSPPPPLPLFQRYRALVIRGFLVVVLLGCAFLVSYFLVRKLYAKYIRHQRKTKCAWLLQHKDFSFASSPPGRRSRVSHDNVSSVMESFAPSEHTNQFFTGDMMLARVRSQPAVVTLFSFSHPHVPKLAYIEWSMVHELNHPNVARFLGVSLEDRLICVASEYCGRGSLRDLLMMKKVELTIFMKYLLLQDLANGLEYIHSSALGSHGRLSSNHCYVTKQWDLKIGGQGVQILSRFQTDSRRYHDMLMLAPELLHMHLGIRPHNGTRQADVFALGLIVQELMYRCPAYNDPSDAQDILEKIRRDNLSPMDIVMASTEEVYPPWVQLMQSCWNFNPSKRPTIAQVKKHLLKNRPVKYDGKSVTHMKFDLVSDYIDSLEEENKGRELHVRALEAHSERVRRYFMPRFEDEDLSEKKNWVKEYKKTCVACVRIEQPSSATCTAANLHTYLSDLNSLVELYSGIVNKHGLVKLEWCGSRFLFAGGLAPPVCERLYTMPGNEGNANKKVSLTRDVAGRPSRKVSSISAYDNPLFDFSSTPASPIQKSPEFSRITPRLPRKNTRSETNIIEELSENAIGSPIPTISRAVLQDDPGCADNASRGAADEDAPGWPEPCAAVAMACLDMVAALFMRQQREQPDLPLSVSIGVDYGTSFAGVLEDVVPRFTLLGHTVDNAATLQLTAQPMSIRLSEEMHNALILSGGYKMSADREATLKGKGERRTFRLNGRSGFNKRLPPPDTGLTHCVD